jgi:DNA-binding MarR family transcriptional regulator
MKTTQAQQTVHAALMQITKGNLKDRVGVSDIAEVAGMNPAATTAALRALAKAHYVKEEQVVSGSMDSMYRPLFKIVRRKLA